MQPKGPSDASLREQIVGSVQKSGEPHVYSSIDKCIDCLATQVDARYSKWLVVLTDTVDFECVNEKNQFDKESPARRPGSPPPRSFASVSLCPPPTPPPHQNPCPPTMNTRRPHSPSQARARAAVEKVIASMQKLSGLNLVIIDASGIANFDAKHKLWPTWHSLSQKLTDEVGDGNSGLNIEATNTEEIDEAFEKVAGAMASAGASG